MDAILIAINRITAPLKRLERQLGRTNQLLRVQQNALKQTIKMGATVSALDTNIQKLNNSFKTIPTVFSILFRKMDNMMDAMRLFAVSFSFTSEISVSVNPSVTVAGGGFGGSSGTTNHPSTVANQTNDSVNSSLISSMNGAIESLIKTIEKLPENIVKKIEASKSYGPREGATDLSTFFTILGYSLRPLIDAGLFKLATMFRFLDSWFLNANLGIAEWLMNARANVGAFFLSVGGILTSWYRASSAFLTNMISSVVTNIKAGAIGIAGVFGTWYTAARMGVMLKLSDIGVTLSGWYASARGVGIAGATTFAAAAASLVTAGYMLYNERDSVAWFFTDGIKTVGDNIFKFTDGLASLDEGISEKIESIPVVREGYSILSSGLSTITEGWGGITDLFLDYENTLNGIQTIAEELELTASKYTNAIQSRVGKTINDALPAGSDPSGETLGVLDSVFDWFSGASADHTAKMIEVRDNVFAANQRSRQLKHSAKEVNKPTSEQNIIIQNDLFKPLSAPMLKNSMAMPYLSESLSTNIVNNQPTQGRGGLVTTPMLSPQPQMINQTATHNITINATTKEHSPAEIAQMVTQAISRTNLFPTISNQSLVGDVA